MNDPYFRPPRAAAPCEGLVFLRPEQIHLPTRPADLHRRADCRPNAVIRLSESIRRYGILEPLSVRTTTDRDGYPRYELVSGERRYRAACLAGIEKIPCIVLRADDRTCAVSSILDRLTQENPDMFEQAAAFRALIDEYGLTQGEIARKLSMSQSAVANKLRLLKLGREERECILRGGLTERHARTLLRLSDPETRLRVLRRVRAEELNVADTEALVDALLAPATPLKPVTMPVETSAEPPQPLTASTEPAKAPIAPAGAPIHPQGAVPLSYAPESPAKPVEVSVQPRGTGLQPDAASISTASPESASAPAESPVQPPDAPAPSEVPPLPPRGVCPRKFALQDLRPLYNSIDRTLSIFRKTGSEAICTREESDDRVRIVISIPRHA